MTLAVPETITCPACGQEQVFTLYRSLNVTLDPARKVELLEGELTRFDCGACGHTAQVSHALLYHDMERSLMIWLVPGEGATPDPLTDDLAKMGAEAQTLGQNYRWRMVRSRNELIEKIRLFDDDLDDRAVEVVKLALLANLPEDLQRSHDAILYDGLADEDGTSHLFLVVISPEGFQWFALPRSDYDRHASLLEPLLPAGQQVGEWQVVDREYASQLLLDWDRRTS